MKHIIPATKARKDFFDLIERVDATGQHYIITKGGRAKAVIMDPDEYESWQETLEIMADPEALKDIRDGLRDIRKGRVKTFEQVFGMTPEEALKAGK